jgi:prepilin-type N-terminal cleavage/methylation domain-containing protein
MTFKNNLVYIFHVETEFKPVFDRTSTHRQPIRARNTLENIMTVNSLSLNPGIRQRQAGYTLIELSISLSIIAVLLVGTLTGVNRLLRSNDANNTISATQSAVTYISKLYKASTDPTIYSTLKMAQMGVWDSSAVTLGVPTGGATVKNAFGGNIEVGKNDAAVGTAAKETGYWYRLSGIPADSCATLATSFVNTADGIYINAAKATTATTIGATGTTGIYKVPGTAANSTANLATGCGLNGANGTVELALFILS